jgi:NAD+ diphosphatase
VAQQVAAQVRDATILFIVCDRGDWYLSTGVFPRDVPLEPQCATQLQATVQQEDGGPKERLRCPACGWTHWNGPTPVLAAIVEYEGKILLARNAAWRGKMYALITGFMEAGESPQDGSAREVKEETSLDVTASQLMGVYDFQRMTR